MLSLAILALSGLLFLSAFVMHLVYFSSSYEGKQRMGFVLIRVAFLMLTLFFISEIVAHQLPVPVFAFGQALVFFAWTLAFVYLVLFVRAQNQSFGLILNPILTLLIGAAWFAFTLAKPDAAKEIPHALQNPLFIVHIGFAFFAYASFTLSFAAGVLYLIQSKQLKSKMGGTLYQKFPSLEELERLIFQPLFWGAPLLFLAILIGVFWSKSAFGHYWIFDPKTICTTLIALFYFIILGLRFGSALRGRQGAIFSMLAFGLVIVCFVGIRFIHGSHDYLQTNGSGAPAQGEVRV